MRWKAVEKSFLLTTAKPPVSSDSVRRLSCDRRSSFWSEPGADAERRVVGERPDLDRLVAEVGQAARVDAVDRHVRAGRRADRVARRVEDHRRAADGSSRSAR